MKHAAVITVLVGAIAGVMCSGRVGWASVAPVSLPLLVGLPPTIQDYVGPPPAEQLWATEVARAVRKGVRKAFRHVVWSGQRWVQWGSAGLLFALIALPAPLIGRELLRTWREQGFTAFRTAFALGLAVHVRLLFDSRSPMLGKGLLVLTLAYAIKRNDLMADWWMPIGLVDDIIALGVASRLFMWLCPDALVEEHAVRATRGRERNLRRRLLADVPSHTREPAAANGLQN